ncbi:MAG: fumarylacetoacetate hydrolase family protein [Chloroflexota bacterium]
MKIVRFQAGRKTGYGVWDGKEIKGLAGTPYGKIAYTDRKYKLDDVRLLAPCLPSKIVAAGLNYRSHIEEVGARFTPANPILVFKPPTAVIGPEDNIIYPDTSDHLDYEGELALVMKSRAHRVPAEAVKDYILGYTCLNDVTCRDHQRQDRQWTRSKAFDTFCPIGPCIETEIDPAHAQMETRRNGELKQQASTSDLLFPVPELVSFISFVMTLLPGDVIATGTPEGISELKVGDTIEVTIEGIGTLRNYVARQPK